MSKCPGLHCDGCGKGGGITAGAVVTIIAFIIVIANGRAIGHAASDVGHVIVTGLMIMAACTGLAAITTGAVLAVRLRVRARARTAALAPPATVPGRLVSVSRPAVSGPHRAAIGPAPAGRAGVPAAEPADWYSPVSDSRQ
jgi:hypothetical protein